MDSEKLKEKIKEKRSQRTKKPNMDNDLMKMMEQVTSVLKTNPQMVQQISKCVSSVMNNKELMDSLAGQLEQQIQKEEN